MSKNMIQWLEIGDLDIHISDGNYSSKYPRSEEFIESGVPFIRANNLVNKSISDEEMYFISPQKHGLLKKGHLKTNDVLISTRGDLGKVALVPKRYNDSNINAQLVLLRPNPHKIDPLYLLYCFEGDRVKGQISQLQTGTALKQLPVGNLKRIKIPLPPLEEQRRIAAILDKADGVRRKRKEAIRLTEELLKSTFLEMFGYSSDESVSIGELLDKGVLLLHKDGNHGSNYPRTSEFGIEGIPFLSANCFSDSGEMITDNVKFLSESKANKLKIGWLEHSDVLLAHNATVGRVALYDGRYKQALVGTSLTIFRPHREYLLPEFLFGVLRSEMFQKQLAHNMEQSTRNQVPITAQRDLKIKLAPLKKQLKFKELFHHVMNISKKYESSNQESENLFNSLLQRAFRGEL